MWERPPAANGYAVEPVIRGQRPLPQTLDYARQMRCRTTAARIIINRNAA
jgi:hypothetical protein